MSTILLGVTGSIAAYKAAELTRLLVKAGHDVHVIMTRSACEFITPLTLQTLSRNPVSVDAFEKITTWNPHHVSLAQSADLVVVAPATANSLAKFAHGFADDLLSSTVLASRAPLLVAPAMNSGMWENPTTVANVKILAERKINFVGPGVGELACGASGTGCMAALELIMEKISLLLAEKY